MIVLITGATSGIGRATAEIFASHGHTLILCGRRMDRLVALAESLQETHAIPVYPCRFDIRSSAECKNAWETIPLEYRPVDILINNAGLASGLDPIQEGQLEDWDQMLDTNVKGLLYITRLVSPEMVARKKGHIINICSTAGKEIYPKGNVYCASKAAVDMLTKGMRLDLYQHGIRVSQIAPGMVEETEFALVRFHGDNQKANIYENIQPLKASDVAETIYFVATRPAHVNIQDVLMMCSQQAGSNFVDRSGR
jgi:NADP-dependent 3-hydroxy acid dehydrogenase YdfG